MAFAELRPLARTDGDAARALLAAAGLTDAARVADEKLFEPGPGAEATGWAACAAGQLVGVAASSARWLRLVAVAPAARGRGVGSALLAAVEHDVRARGETRLSALDQPGNYLSPGVAADDLVTLAWLGRRGFVAGREAINLSIDVATNPRVSAARSAELAAAAGARGYRVERAGAAGRAALLAMIERDFGGAWPFEVARALEASPAGVHVALAAGAPVAFAAHDGNNRGLGWFGPAGTLPAHRGQRLGEALLMACLVDIAAAGHAAATIAWIGPREFYDRVAGIAGERRYLAMTKELS